jgi:hypothetical protein
MKKVNSLLLVVIFVGMGVNSFAQLKVAIGLKAGPNFANLNVHDANATYENRTGWHGGAFLLIKGEKVGVQPEILFSKQGSTIKVNQQDLKANYSYINIPIILKLYTVLGINLQIGPQFGFLTKAESDYDPITKQTYASARDVQDAYKKSDVSLAMGAGWDLPFGLTIDGRYNLGLTELNNNSSVEETKNQVWQISVGYKIFNLGKE